MEAWFSMVIRQGMLYSFPLLITFSAVLMMEYYFLKKRDEFQLEVLSLYIWLPFLVTIIFGRAMIIFLFPPSGQGLKPALIRCAAHVALCMLGWLLYSWALAHPPLAGLPPLHHWWAKVLMYLNLCLVALHLLPIPGMTVGEWLVSNGYAHRYFGLLQSRPLAYVIALSIVAASPLLDSLLGDAIVFPVYELMASLAT